MPWAFIFIRIRNIHDTKGYFSTGAFFNECHPNVKYSNQEVKVGDVLVLHINISDNSTRVSNSNAIFRDGFRDNTS